MTSLEFEYITKSIRYALIKKKQNKHSYDIIALHVVTPV